jgi:Molecular chaperone (small heat shock protein)
MNIVRFNYPSTRIIPAESRFRLSPWTGLEAEIERFFDAALNDVVGAPSAGRFPVDIYEDKDKTYVRAELPGVERDAIQVEYLDGYLTLSAQRRSKEAGREESVSFSRSVGVPDNVQVDRVTASYENGVLTVTLPKKEEAKPRKINVSLN